MSRLADPGAGHAPADVGRGARPRSATAAAVVIVLLALNLRTLVASLPPLLGDVRADLGLSGFTGGLLTTLPVLGFGAFAPLAPRLARRISLERLLVGCAVLSAVAAALRGAGGAAALFAGCALAGVAVAIAQVVLPVLIRTRHPERTGMLTGAYSMSLTLGAALAAAVAVPLMRGFDDSWRAALAAWALPAALAAAVWLPAALGPGTRVGGEPPPALTRSGLAWSVSLFMGVQSMAFYAGLSWIPTVLEDAGFSEGEAGTLQALGAILQLAPAFAVPVLAARRTSQVGLLLSVVGLALAGVLGLLVAPGAAVAWVALIGVGQGGALGLALILPVLRGGDAASVAALTAMALCVGYLVAALGPWLLGAVYDLTGDWTVPLAVLAGICVAELGPGLRAARPGLVTA